MAIWRTHSFWPTSAKLSAAVAGRLTPRSMCWRCLEEADQHDLARAWRAKCDARDTAECRTIHVRYYAQLVGDTIGRMNVDRSSWSLANPNSAPPPNFFSPEPSGVLFLFELRFFEVEHDLEPP